MNKIFKIIMTILFVLLSMVIKAQSDTLMTNRIINDTNAHADILFGYCNLEGLKYTIPFKTHWDYEYSTYMVDNKTLDSIKGDLRNIQIKIVFASWCDDSRQQVPRFIKILENIDFDMNNIKIIAVDKKKKAGDILLENFDIQKVPTFIIYRNGIEIGRIIETPHYSLENDFLHIIN